MWTVLAFVGETPEYRTGGGEVPDQRRTGNSHCPTAPEITIPPHLFTTLLIERLQLPRQFTAAACQDARFLWTFLGLHQGSCTRTRDTITVVVQSRSNRQCSWSLVFLLTLRRRHFDEHTRTLKRLKWERCEPKPSTRFAASQPRRHRAEGPRKYGKSGRLRICGGPSEAPLSKKGQISECCRSCFGRSDRAMRVVHSLVPTPGGSSLCPTCSWVAEFQSGAGEKPGCKRNAG